MTGPQNSRTVYDGKQFDVVVEEWGGRAREIVEHPGSTAIVAVDGEGFVTLVRQLREPARRPLVELPAGTLEDGEEPLANARRELEEEVGLTGGTWRELGAFYTSPGFCRERMHIFLAVDVERGTARPEDDEEIEILRWPLAAIPNRLAELEDAKTIAGLALFLQSRA